MISLQTQPDGSSQSRTQAVPEPSTSRVVPKPVPQSQTQDPRQYQLQQVRRRFSPKETKVSDGATSLLFRLAPSDPDFPFELDYLDCDLRVPKDYPEERPTLLVKNKGMPRGFCINVEKGWDRLVSEKKGATLLALIHALDKNLEGFLSEQKAETVKLVAFKDTRHLSSEAPSTAPADVIPPTPEPAKPVPVQRRYVPEPSYSREQIGEAKARRAREIHQLETRMGRLPAYRRSADGIIFTLPIEPKRRRELPSGLQFVNTIHLIVPLLYPLQDIRVQLNETEAADAEPVEELFVERAAEQKHMTLMSHVNYLAQNLHTLAKQAEARVPQPEVQQHSHEEDIQAETQPEHESSKSEDKSHIQYIQRPPEWNVVHGEDDSEESSDPDSADDGGVALDSGDAMEGVQHHQQQLPAETPERGTMISFPSIELHGIEILQVALLSITVKCERCKTVNEITGLKPGFEKTTVCKKCSVPMAAKFQQQLVHENSTRAGFIDLAGCKVSDMLPSTFVPTCGRCSTPGMGLVSVRGESMTNVCRECHGRFTFKIPEVKFLFIAPGTLPPPTSGPRRKQERLGLHAGEPLPGRGACSHYRKSYRWFRFSCCSRVHACDRCHDEAEDHENEWANRMICGWCSREQNYAVEACGFCGRSVIGRKGKGFWEGGKGTRDQMLMSRKDPRKYKRLGGGGGGQASKKD